MRDGLDRAGLKRGPLKPDWPGVPGTTLVLETIRWSWGPYAGPGVHMLVLGSICCVTRNIPWLLGA